MDNSGPSRQHTQPAVLARGFLARLRSVGDILRWLASVILPTEEDLIEADVYLGQKRD